MPWSASQVMFRCGVSIPSAVLIACFCSNDALSQTLDISLKPTLTANQADAESGAWDSVAEQGQKPQKDAATDDQPAAKQESSAEERELVGVFNDLDDLGAKQTNSEPESSNLILTEIPVGLASSRHRPIESQSLLDRSQKLAPSKSNLDSESHPQEKPSFKTSWGDLQQFSVQTSKPATCQQQTCNFLAQTNPNQPSNLNPSNVDPGDLNPSNLTPDPNRDRFLQPPPQPTPEPPQAPPQVEPQPTPSPQPELPNVPIPVQKIDVVGSTILTREEIDAIVKPLEGRSVTLEQLREAADKITTIYLDRGYITSRAVVPPQTISDGKVQIQVIEGKLAKIEVEGTKRLNPSYVRSRIRLGAGRPLSTAKLEDQLRLLRVDPLFDNVEASLRAGDKEGESILIVRVIEANAFQANFSIDNYSPPSVGSERLGVNVRHRNITGRGDELAAAYYRAIGDSDVFDFSYRIPVNAMNGTVQLRVAPNRNSIVQAPFDQFDISGKSHLYEISYRQPLLRSPIQEFAVSLGFTYQRGRTYLAGDPFPFGLGPGEEGSNTGVTTTSVIKIGQDYIRRDPRGAWALRSQFSIGTGLFDATVNESPVPDGLFFSWLGQVQRVQRLNENHLLILQADLQLSANSLLPSQQFVIGGGQSLRGYRQNVRSGDNGFRFSVEDRITIDRDPSSKAPTLQLAPFIDMGMVWNSQNNPNKIAFPNTSIFGGDRAFLAGIGLGILWEPMPKVNVRIDYALPIISIQDKGNNAQDSGFYFSVIYSP
ncbi:ShlB/FhaC/HecB family hemolysin secretion/activation protein [Kamptonema sp. UHCC 0994]|uniref:ShlB/FhaC/HecB family hemolysin secretion/activation protein n=1 Tax=Kamptonema sp. UHCC 0994 TaxID=3031329 RepID=UPI0023B9AD7E|nr:ShlB/FhaC/HecB family hemolysin secretion/activation protein [Kamptonema sp. UHCC 0994]MDF0555134.1 ShlB/FhaC/HecB family hemolysin secretion/activation protein [Kamptonema sp. UHCC 0994]